MFSIGVNCRFGIEMLPSYNHNSFQISFKGKIVVFLIKQIKKKKKNLLTTQENLRSKQAASLSPNHRSINQHSSLCNL